MAQPLGAVNYEPAVIFGAGNKLRYYGPFLTLFEEFRQRLARTRIVLTIGYSYRDEHVNDALRMWARSLPGNKRLLVGLGPGTTDLPQAVVPWKVYDNVDVQAVQGTASEVIRRLDILT